LWLWIHTVSVTVTVTVSGTVTATVTVSALPIGVISGRLSGLPNGIGAFALALHARMHPLLHTVTDTVTDTVTVTVSVTVTVRNKSRTDLCPAFRRDPAGDPLQSCHVIGNAAVHPGVAKKPGVGANNLRRHRHRAGYEIRRIQGKPRVAHTVSKGPGQGGGAGGKQPRPAPGGQNVEQFHPLGPLRGACQQYTMSSPRTRI
jgi:hypothetical protein